MRGDSTYNSSLQALVTRLDTLQLRARACIDHPPSQTCPRLESTHVCWGTAGAGDSKEEGRRLFGWTGEHASSLDKTLLELLCMINGRSMGDGEQGIEKGAKRGAEAAQQAFHGSFAALLLLATLPVQSFILVLYPPATQHPQIPPAHRSSHKALPHTAHSQRCLEQSSWSLSGSGSSSEYRLDAVAGSRAGGEAQRAVLGRPPCPTCSLAAPWLSCRSPRPVYVKRGTLLAFNASARGRGLSRLLLA
jgi:hypothetical protein